MGFANRRRAPAASSWSRSTRRGASTTTSGWSTAGSCSPGQYPRGPPVHVEDHPIEYSDFEGIIPAGNYGAGAVIVWDRGWWRPLEDPDEGLAKGKLLFELSGYKLQGVWTLVRIRRDPKDWLLIKHQDAFADPSGLRPFADESVLSGRSLEDLAAGRDPMPTLAKELERLGAPRRRVNPREAEPMLAETREQPFSGPDWIFELKYDGFRLRAAREAREALLLYRSGRDAGGLYPEIARRGKQGLLLFGVGRPDEHHVRRIEFASGMREQGQRSKQIGMTFHRM